MQMSLSEMLTSGEMISPRNAYRLCSLILTPKYSLTAFETTPRFQTRILFSRESSFESER
jgi:hypothetical protein